MGGKIYQGTTRTTAPARAHPIIANSLSPTRAEPQDRYQLPLAEKTPIHKRSFQVGLHTEGRSIDSGQREPEGGWSNRASRQEVIVDSPEKNSPKQQPYLELEPKPSNSYSTGNNSTSKLIKP